MLAGVHAGSVERHASRNLPTCGRVTPESVSVARRLTTAPPWPATGVSASGETRERAVGRPRVEPHP